MTNGAGKWSVGAELGRELREIRERRGKTLSDVALAKVGSRQKLSRMETGQGPWRYADVKVLCELYGLSALDTALFCDMALASSETTFSDPSNPARFGLYLRMEGRAQALTVVTIDVIHGLFQTPEYHAAMQQDWIYPSPEHAEQQFKQRQARQIAFWNRQDVHIESVMSEAALKRVVGSRSIMKEQMEHLHLLGQRDGVKIRFIPQDFPSAPGLPGQFTLISTNIGDAAYVEHIDGGRILSNPTVVTDFRNAASLASKASRDIGEWQ
ncbi:helix-turn-helix domain-containing protein [Kineosporia sp. J2-2]|uniref:Helix-turn-helix domain-containing protein n=1 Tax=Kineosporia corallincola TaxID=2835133 RepID=A0ABS5TIS7_9ACTN|nr:DUF5753 domain-containing protein [Kineosporia corallincola]MBT0769479.1 helix-turn-helix domain-containing protein [Kineosporia corallincola]